MAVRLLMAATAALMAVPLAASAASDWWLIAAGPDGAMQYSCGAVCPRTQLICIRDIEPAVDAVRLEQLANETYTPWGQIDFLMMSRISGDRAGFGKAPEIQGGQREAGPLQVAFGGASWVTARYAIKTKGDDGLTATLLLWPEAQTVVSLRCSYKPGADDGRDVEGAIRQLAGSLRLTP